jgi:hypothetical protein
MTGKCIVDQDNSFRRQFFMILVVLICIGVFGTIGCDEGKKPSSYIGTWKLEKLMPQPGQEWLEAKYPFIMQLLSDGNLEILITAPNLNIRITGTWKILDDGRLQISQEGQDGETYDRPSIIVFSLENKKLTSSARAYVDENEKEQPGFIFIKEGK